MTEQARVWMAHDAISLAYRSYNRFKQRTGGRWGRDRDVRHPEWTRRLLEAFGRPDRAAPNIAVTGSKGKGSHAVLIAAMLQRLGLRVGLFTGPHLVDFMERFRVNGEMMPEAEFIRLMEDVAAEAERLPVPSDQYIGPVGLLAVVAARWFQEQRTDINVFELGRGALHDDVNQVEHVAAVIAPVFLEHAWELGPTLFDVACEKAGVITPQTRFVVSHRQLPLPRVVMRARAEALRADFCCFGAEFPRQADEPFVSSQRSLGTAEDIPYLHENAQVAWETVRRVCRFMGLGERLQDFRFDLGAVRLPGRLQVVRRAPLTVVDGTIHGASAEYVARWVQGYCRGGQTTGRPPRVGIVIGIPVDKDVAGVLAAFHGIAEFAVLTQAHNPHLHFDYRMVKDLAWMFPGGMMEVPFVEDALVLADQRLEDKDVLLLLGTQSFVGDALKWFGHDTGSIWVSSDDRGM